VVVEVSGEFHSMELRPGMRDLAPLSNTTKRWARPVPIGVSTGNAGECSAGTISARVKNAAGDVFALSNNHVYALQNNAPIGSDIRQPGLFDTVPQCANRPGDTIGTLADFKPMVFTTTAKNKIDAAIAETSTANLKNKTPGDGYGMPLSATEAGTVGRDVQKFGRTTKLTHGEISSINTTVNVGYPSGTARFVKQIIVSQPAGLFIQPGDSGSLLVGDPDRHTIGLLFAGNGPGTLAVANRIDLVLNEFGVTIDGQ
jgi:hypothetical protein